MDVYIARVFDSAGDQHEAYAFSNEQAALDCGKFLESLPLYQISKGWSHSFSILEIDADYESIRRIGVNGVTEETLYING